MPCPAASSVASVSGAPITFMAGCMPRVPLREQVAVVAQAGFEAVSCWPNIWRHALRKDGLTLSDMRSLLDDHGLRLTVCEACQDWVPGPTAAVPGGAAGREEMFEVCAALGGTAVTAVHPDPAALVFDRDVEGFAQLCDDAAEHGLHVALEFVAFLGIRDVATAWAMVDAAGRANGGLVVDLWHHVRAGRDDDALRRVRAERVLVVQLADGPLRPAVDLSDEAMYHRLLPGAGEMDVAGLLGVLADMGVRAPIGPEVYVPVDGRSPADVAALLMVATRAVMAAAHTPG
jgi:sugar phosphate isomerase/epimerase